MSVESEQEPIGATIHRYGSGLARLERLKELNAPKQVLENEIRMNEKRRLAVRERIFEAVKFIKERVKGMKDVTDEIIVRQMPELATTIAKHYQAKFDAHTLFEHLDDGHVELGDDGYPTEDSGPGTAIKITWEDIGEGLSGDYNPDDPNDVKLLRFYIYRERENDFLQVDDGSACTQMPVGTPYHLMAHALRCIWEEVRDALNEDTSIKKIVEEISWCEPKWFEEGNRWEYKEAK